MKTRNTHQKEIIQNIMQGKGVHKHAEDVLLEAKQMDSSIGLATIYLNLNSLVQQGKIQKIEGTGYSYYDANPVPHDHFICSECGDIMDVISDYDQALDSYAEIVTGAKIVKHSITYEGLCEKCLKIHEGEK